MSLKCKRREGADRDPHSHFACFTVATIRVVYSYTAPDVTKRARDGQSLE